MKKYSLHWKQAYVKKSFDCLKKAIKGIHSLVNPKGCWQLTWLQQKTLMMHTYKWLQLCCTHQGGCTGWREKGGRKGSCMIWFWIQSSPQHWQADCSTLHAIRTGGDNASVSQCMSSGWTKIRFTLLPSIFPPFPNLETPCVDERQQDLLRTTTKPEHAGDARLCRVVCSTHAYTHKCFDCLTDQWTVRHRERPDRRATKWQTDRRQAVRLTNLLYAQRCSSWEQPAWERRTTCRTQQPYTENNRIYVQTHTQSRKRWRPCWIWKSVWQNRHPAT